MTSAPEPTASHTPAACEPAPALPPAAEAPRTEAAAVPSLELPVAVYKAAPEVPAPVMVATPPCPPVPQQKVQPVAGVKERKAPLAFTTGTLELLDETTDRDLMLSSLDHPQAVIATIAKQEPPTGEAVAARPATALQVPATSRGAAAGPLPSCQPYVLRRRIAISLVVYVVVVMVCLWLKYAGVPWAFLPIAAAALPPISLGVRLLRE